MLNQLFAMGLPAASKAPDFELKDQNGNLHRLSDYRGKWLLLFFYPKDNTRGCTKEACSFRDSRADFQAKGVEVLGISVDGVESHKSFSSRFALNYPILSDADRKVSKAYQVLWPIGIANRVTFLISPDGHIVENMKFVDWDTYADSISIIIEPHLKKNKPSAET